MKRLLLGVIASALITSCSETAPPSAEVMQGSYALNDLQGQKTFLTAPEGQVTLKLQEVSGHYEGILRLGDKSLTVVGDYKTAFNSEGNTQTVFLGKAESREAHYDLTLIANTNSEKTFVGQMIPQTSVYDSSILTEAYTFQVSRP